MERGQDRVEETGTFGAEGEYGPEHDWASDPSGLGLADEAAGSPLLHAWADDRSRAYEALLDCWQDPDAALRNA